MNNTFNLRRFWALLREIWQENYLYFLGVVLVIGLIQLAFGIFINTISVVGFSNSQLTRFFFGAFVGIIAFASPLLKRHQSSSYGIQKVMLPASAFEKWLSSILLIGFLFWLLYAIIFSIVDSFLVKNAITKFNETYRNSLSGNNHQSLLANIVPFKLISQNTKWIYLEFTIIGICILIAGTWFKKATIPLTFVAIAGILLVLQTINWLIINGMYTYKAPFASSLPFGNIVLIVPSNSNEQNVVHSYSMLRSETTIEIFTTFILPFLLLMFSATYFFRLKEKEI